MQNSTYSTLLTRLAAEPFFLSAERLPWLASMTATPAAGEWGLETHLTADGAERPYQLAGEIAVVSGMGTLMKRVGAWYDVDYNALESAVRSASEDPAARAVVLNLCSPGGGVIGCAETAARLVEIREQSGKPQVMVIDYMACSAAYYIGAHMDIVATPSAYVGSIGTIMIREEIHRALAAMGVDFTVYKSGRLKDMSYPLRASTEEETALMQSEIDHCGAQFRGWVTSHRPGVAEETMQGQCFSGQEGLALGLVDALANDLSDALAIVADRLA